MVNSTMILLATPLWSVKLGVTSHLWIILNGTDKKKYVFCMEPCPQCLLFWVFGFFGFFPLLN